MTQRGPALLITFTRPMRVDDVEHMTEFLRQINGVADVSLITSDPTADYIAAKTRDAKWRQELDALQLKMLNESR